MKLIDRATRSPAPPIRLGIAAALDVASVVVFVAVGRRNHDQDPGLAGVFATAAPFLIALAVGWLVARAWYAPMSLRTGVVVWLTTVVGGMLLRNLVFDDGTAASFVVVATAFTAACLLGWRLASKLFRPSW
ncbi:hypothetical protein BH23ACT3_BH23ACT3_19030 [soil metagenome]